VCVCVCVCVCVRVRRSRGYFEFPGGKVEEGETDASALVRCVVGDT